METPLVSVICLCYNHRRFVREAVESVLRQTYSNIQIIIVDDASTDGSRDVIQELKIEFPELEFLLLDVNVGNCKAFNYGLALAKGKYIIDLAADDVLLPTRISVGVDRLETLGEEFGVQYSDAMLVTEEGKDIGLHSDKIQVDDFPSGNIYAEVIAHYFICSPTMIIHKKVMGELGGYDESLHYEDFDFWIRSSRNYKYDYSPEVLIKKRVVKGSLSDVQFNHKSDHWRSTLRVLEKAKNLNRNDYEVGAWRKRVWYEIGYHLKRLSVRRAFNFLNLIFRSAV